MKKFIAGHYTSITYPYPCALTWGNFDGVHRGHQALLSALKSMATAQGLPVVVLIFEPPTSLFFQRSDFTLTALRDKVRFLWKAGVDTVCCVVFNARMASYSSEDFIKDLLLKQLNAQCIMVGEHARFGYQHAGTIEQLSSIGQAMHRQIQVFSEYQLDGERISSTRIRTYMKAAALDKVAWCLGRPYSVIGRLIPGRGIGKSILGFPTANIHVNYKYSPLSGVFIVYLIPSSGQELQGVANWGVRPTVDGKKRVLEVHVLTTCITLTSMDFTYGQWMEVQFLKKIRDEHSFSSLDELKKQIQCDTVIAKKFFEQNLH